MQDGGAGVATHDGKWSSAEQTDGGCMNHSSWANNPQFFLSFPSNPTDAQHIEVALTQQQGASLHGIGFYILKSDGDCPSPLSLFSEHRSILNFRNNPRAGTGRRIVGRAAALVVENSPFGVRQTGTKFLPLPHTSTFNRSIALCITTDFIGASPLRDCSLHI